MKIPKGCTGEFLMQYNGGWIRLSGCVCNLLLRKNPILCIVVAKVRNLSQVGNSTVCHTRTLKICINIFFPLIQTSLQETFLFENHLQKLKQVVIFVPLIFMTTFFLKSKLAIEVGVTAKNS